MSSKRLVISLATVVILLAIAGVLELLLVLFPAASMANAELRVQDTILTRVESSVVAPDPAQGERGVPSEAQVRAAELVKAGALVVDGEPLQRDDAEELVAAARPYVENVAHVDQRAILPSGCEIVALSVALNAEGFDASPIEIAENHLHVGDDFATDYIGSPLHTGGGFPPCIVDAANSYLSSQGSSARAVNLTGSTFAGVVDLTALGYPVVAWTTENMATPSPRGEERNGLRWYSPEHCVVVYGVEGGEVLVSDSLAGLVRRDRAEFERVYGQCGSLALLVQP